MGTCSVCDKDGWGGVAKDVKELHQALRPSSSFKILLQAVDGEMKLSSLAALHLRLGETGRRWRGLRGGVKLMTSSPPGAVASLSLGASLSKLVLTSLHLDLHGHFEMEVPCVTVLTLNGAEP